MNLFWSLCALLPPNDQRGGLLYKLDKVCKVDFNSRRILNEKKGTRMDKWDFPLAHRSLNFQVPLQPLRCTNKCFVVLLGPSLDVSVMAFKKYQIINADHDLL